MPPTSASSDTLYDLWQQPASRWPATPDSNVWLDALLQQALAQRVQALYLAANSPLPVRYRIDGRLVRGPMLPAAVCQGLIDTLSQRAGFTAIDSDPKAAQPTRLPLHVDGRTLDTHLSRLPGRDGFHLHLRLHTHVYSSLDRLGVNEDTAAQLRELCRSEGGLTLITGPAASGKRTTLYALLEQWNPLQQQRLLLEQRGGRALPQTTQIATATPSSLLPAALEQDPDLLLVDELDDPAALQLLVRAALRGKSILLRSGAPDTPSAIAELLDQGVSANLLADALNGVIEQRLLRRLCDHCALDVSTPDALEQLFSDASSSLPARHAQGCAHCHYSGYRGQMPVLEVHVWDTSERHLLRQGRYLAEAEVNPHCSFASQCSEWITQGLTSVAEVDRVLGNRFWQALNPFALGSARRLRQPTPAQWVQPTLLVLDLPDALGEMLEQRYPGQLCPVSGIEQAARLCFSEPASCALLMYNPTPDTDAEQQLRACLEPLYCPVALIDEATPAALQPLLPLFDRLLQTPG